MIIVANWKMNKNANDVELFLRNLEANLSKYPKFTDKTKVLIAPPFPFLYYLKTSLHTDTITLTAQNIHHEKQGAFTGEVSAEMLCSIGVKYVIIGHSERRIYFNETENILSKKIERCLENKMTPIFCFGETYSDRNLVNHLSVIKKQYDSK